MAVTSPPRWSAGIVMLTSQSIVILITSYLIYEILKSQRQMSNVNKGIFRSGMAFMAANWLFTLFIIVASIYSLYQYFGLGIEVLDQSGHPALDFGAGFFFLLQNYLLIIALFVRLRGLFQSGPLRISKCTTSLYIIALSLVPVLCLSIPVAHGLGRGAVWQLIMTISVIGLNGAILSSLLALLIWKLKQIQKNKTLRISA